MNTKPNLKAIIDNNLDKTGHIPSKGQSRLPKEGWLDSYKSGGSYASSWMLTNPKPAPVSFPRMDNGGEEKYKRSISDNTRVAPRQVRGESDAELMDYFLKYKKPYEPSQSVKKIKAGLSAADLTTIPFTGNPIGFAVNRGLGALNSIADASTSFLYAKDGQWENAGIDFGEALLDLIPFRKGKRAINLSKTKPGFIVNNLSNTDKAINTLLKIGKAGSYVDDFQDVFPRKENGGTLLHPIEGYNPMIPYSQAYTDLQYKKFTDFNNPRPPLKPIAGDNFDTYFSSFKPTGYRTNVREGWIMTNPKNDIEVELDGDINNPPEIKPKQKLEWKKTELQQNVYPSDRDFVKFFSTSGKYQKRNGGDISIPDLDADKWLMKYDDGGEPSSSIPTDDPRKVQAYSDSLYNYNLTKKFSPAGTYLNKKDYVNSTPVKPKSVGTAIYPNSIRGNMKPARWDNYITGEGFDKNFPEYSVARYKKPVQPYTLEEQVRPIGRGEIERVSLNTSNYRQPQMLRGLESLNIQAPEQNYKVQYYDPQTKKMTHRMFADEQAGSAFRTSLGFPENQYGVEGSWQKKYGGWLNKHL